MDKSSWQSKSSSPIAFPSLPLQQNLYLGPKGTNGFQWYWGASPGSPTPTGPGAPFDLGLWVHAGERLQTYQLSAPSALQLCLGLDFCTAGPDPASEPGHPGAMCLIWHYPDFHPGEEASPPILCSLLRPSWHERRWGTGACPEKTTKLVKNLEHKTCWGAAEGALGPCCLIDSVPEATVLCLTLTVPLLHDKYVLCHDLFMHYPSSSIETWGKVKAEVKWTYYEFQLFSILVPVFQ